MVAALGVGFAGIIFLLGALSLAGLAQFSKTAAVEEKIVDALHASDIKFPQDPRNYSEFDTVNGIDTFTDCLALDIDLHYNDRFLDNLFDSRFDDLAHMWALRGVKDHACNNLNYVLAAPSSYASSKKGHYYRYWWGSAVLARVALGLTDISFGNYRRLIHGLSYTAIIFYALSFICAYGRQASVVFSPFFLSIFIGYGLESFGQSIAHAPEFIFGLFFLSAYNFVKADRFPPLIRAICYSLLGYLCCYFELMDGNVIAVMIFLCCQMLAPSVGSCLARSTSISSDVIKNICQGLALFSAGFLLALLIRLVGYSFAQDVSIGTVFIEWLSGFVYRVSGPPSLPETGEHFRRSWITVLYVLNRMKAVPFIGFLNGAWVDLYYLIGLASWALSFSLCITLLRRERRVQETVVGFVLTACLVPAWFLLLEEHTIMHPWMTVRLVPLFLGLGMSLAVFLGLAPLKRASPEDTQPASRAPSGSTM